MKTSYDLRKAGENLMDHLAFMASIGAQKYPFKPSPECVLKLEALRNAIDNSEAKER